MSDTITPYGLRQHAGSLYPPNRERGRELLYLAAGELERTREELARMTRETAIIRAEIDRLVAANAALRERGLVLEREAELSRWTAHRLAQIAAKGATP